MRYTAAVLVLNWNGTQFLSRCFESLLAQTACGIQIVLVDNGSTDGSIPFTRTAFPDVTIIDLGYNYGYAEANNRAAAVVDAEYLFFLNNDTHLDPGALQALIQEGIRTPAAAIFAPQQCSYDGAHTLHTGLSLDLLGYPSLGKTFYADGAALFVRRSAFLALGGFDNAYFMFFEDADLCWRAWLWGYRIKGVPAAVVYHRVGGTTGSTLLEEGRHTTTLQKRRLAHRNQLATLYKNYSLFTLILLGPLLLVACLAEVLLLTLTGQHQVFRKAYLPAWRDLVRERHHLRDRRRAVQAARRVSDLYIVRHLRWTFIAVRVLLDHGIPRIL